MRLRRRSNVRVGPIAVHAVAFDRAGALPSASSQMVRQRMAELRREPSAEPGSAALADAVERQRGDVAGSETGCAVEVHPASDPDNEVAEQEETRRRRHNASRDTQHGHLAQEAAGEQAYGGIPCPGDQVPLDLEREAFLSLCGERKTQERIAFTLKTGKPLRN